MPCRINKRREWVSRIMLEAQDHTSTAFLTLTYDDEHVPRHGDSYTLEPDHLRDFWKRLRINIERKFDAQKIRYYAVGEYGHEGERKWNPHYHAALFGFGCAGKIYHANDYPRCHCPACLLVYESWQYGNISQDELNDTTAGYIAGYVIKKMTNPDDYRLEGRKPEFQRQSQGLGRNAIEPLSETLQSTYGHLAFKDGDIPHSIRVGSRDIVLSRYLRNKLRESLGLEKVNPETGVIGYGTPVQKLEALEKEASPQVWLLRESLKNVPLFSKERKAIYAQIADARKKQLQRSKQKVRNLESRFNIRGKRNETI